MDKFLDTYSIPKLNKKNTTMSNENERVIESPNKEEPKTRWIHC
jgi:hypothetical protein